MTVIFIRALGSKGPFCRYGNEVCESACGERDDGSEVDKGGAGHSLPMYFHLPIAQGRGFSEGG